MIGYLKGKVQYEHENSIIIDVSGVGYHVEIGSRQIKANVGDTIVCYIYTYMRENEIRLFGFHNTKELDVFELVLTVNGVGPKSALMLVSQLGEREIVNAILRKKPEILKVPGIGLKTANKIVLELSDKLRKMGYTTSGENKHFFMDDTFKEKIDQAAQALKSLGYTTRDIKKVTSETSFSKKHLEMNVEQLIKYLLSII